MSKAGLLRRVQALEARHEIPAPSPFEIVLGELSVSGLEALLAATEAHGGEALPAEMGSAILREHAPNPGTFNRWMNLLETT